MIIIHLIFTPNILDTKRFSNFEGDILEGELPKRAVQFVQEWISYHKKELEDNWEKARSGHPLSLIAPLE